MYWSPVASTGTLRAPSPELLLARRVVQHVDGNKVDALLRKKLFRSKAAASAGLRKQNEMISGFSIKNSSELRRFLQQTY